MNLKQIIKSKSFILGFSIFFVDISYMLFDSELLDIKDILTLLLAIVSVAISLLAISQSNKSLSISNKQFLFDRRMNVKEWYDVISDLYIPTFEFEEENDILTNSFDDYKQQTDFSFSLIAQHYLLENKFNYSNLKNEKDYEQERINLLRAMVIIDQIKKDIDYIFTNKIIIENTFLVINEYVKTLKIYNTYYYTYFKGKDKSKGNIYQESVDEIRVLNCNIRQQIKEQQNKLVEIISNIDKKEMEKLFKQEINILN